MSDFRLRLIERLCRLPDAHLPRIEAVFESLDFEPSPIAIELPVKDWPHAPLHRLSEQGTYIVTASTMHKQHHFRGAERLTLLETELLRRAKAFEIQMEAWAVFSNHYHFVAHVASGENRLRDFLSSVHTATAATLNRMDGQSNRRIWFQFWDTRLTFEKSYLARLHYVHENAVKHRLVAKAVDYPWCSTAWFERESSASALKTIRSFKIDRVKVDDDYEPVV